YDLPFALVYLTDGEPQSPRLAAMQGIGTDAQICSRMLGFLGEKSTIEVELEDAGLDPISNEVWPEPVTQALGLPLRYPGADRLAGFLIAGISRRLSLDDGYRTFLDLAGRQVATAIASARAYEHERRRAEGLAEVDRAKTVFFSNVSHEFRTPLTLMLGPLQDLLSRSEGDLSPAARQQLELMNRNGARLLRLVNTLLDFSRIEAGRVQAVYQATDLAGFTAELAGVFRSATERAGLRLSVDCRNLGEPVYVDRDMWEKIVLNLISNAFKFTFDGEIAVSIDRMDDVA